MNRLQLVNRLLFGLAVLPLLLASPLQAASLPLQCEATSGSNRIAVVELYTSEGCSSCPPADRWLSALSVSSGLGPDKVLPLAFHVDYWDYIGWKDPFADPRFTRRQEVIAVRNRQRSLYTPQVVVDSTDWRQWWEPRPFLSQVTQVNQQAAPLTVQLQADWRPKAQGVVQFSTEVMPVSSAQVGDRSTLHIAVFEHQLETDVKRGENAGKTLRHDAVVRAWQDVGSVRSGKAEYRAQSVKIPPDIKPTNMGVAALVQDRSGAVVQAVSCRCKAAS
jgi:hypothetical protein